MNPFRGILLIAAGVFVAWRGWMVHTHTNALPFYAAGVVAVALGAWRLLRKPPKPLA